jgi:hypothetical protein
LLPKQYLLDTFTSERSGWLGADNAPARYETQMVTGLLLIVASLDAKQSGIASILLAYSLNAQWHEGNLQLAQSEAIRTDGSRLEVRDAYFEVQAAPQPPHKGIKTDSSVRIPMNMVAKFEEENSPSFANVLIRRDDEVATLPWPIRSINTGLSQATKPVIQWSQGTGFTNGITRSTNVGDTNVENTNVGNASIEELEPPSKETKPNRWLAEFLKRFSLKR